MIDLKKIQDEIYALNEALREKQDEYEVAKESNLKERYGADFGCWNCAYCEGACFRDNFYYCKKLEEAYLRNYHCNDYVPKNDLSEYIHNNYYFYLLDTLNDLLGVDDIMRYPELHQKALKILKLRDAKDEQNYD